MNLPLFTATTVCAIVALGTTLWLWFATLSEAGIDRMPAMVQAQAGVGNPHSSELIEVPQMAGKKPTFVLDDLAGARHDLSYAPGRVILVHFFATWCEPCREELPMLQRLLERSQDSTLAVFAISVAEPDDRVRRFFESMPLSFPVVLDRDRAVAKAWRIATLPTTYVLDRELQPRLMVEGEFGWDGVEAEQLLSAVLPVR